MGMMPLTRAFFRLAAVQGSWSYERMLGTGMGFAALPLLEDLRTADPQRYRDAVARQAEFFNAQPFLAGLALGAATRAEYDDVPGEKIARLRTALCGPLGALGDQLFWTGLLPTLVAAAMVGIALGWAVVGLVGFLVAFNAIRMAVAWWGLRRGWRAGLQVGSVVQKSWLPRAILLVGPLAGFTVGLALPIVAGSLLARAGSIQLGVALGCAAIGIVAARISPRVTGLRFTLVMTAFLFLWQWMVS
jgi:PTS system mannose-specific IID component